MPVHCRDFGVSLLAAVILVGWMLDVSGGTSEWCWLVSCIILRMKAIAFLAWMRISSSTMSIRKRSSISANAKATCTLPTARLPMQHSMMCSTKSWYALWIHALASSVSPLSIPKKSVLVSMEYSFMLFVVMSLTLDCLRDHTLYCVKSSANGCQTLT